MVLLKLARDKGFNRLVKIQKGKKKQLSELARYVLDIVNWKSTNVTETEERKVQSQEGDNRQAVLTQLLWMWHLHTLLYIHVIVQILLSGQLYYANIYKRGEYTRLSQEDKIHIGSHMEHAHGKFRCFFFSQTPLSLSLSLSRSLQNKALRKIQKLRGVFMKEWWQRWPMYLLLCMYVCDMKTSQFKDELGQLVSTSKFPLVYLYPFDTM